MNTYSQLSLEERYLLSAWKARGYSILKIAEFLGRHHSTIYRELRRNLRPSGRYAAFVAHSYAKTRNRKCHRGSHFSDKQWNRISDLISQKWSPEQVSNVLGQNGELSISVPTIYRHIKKDRRRGGSIFKSLRIYPKKRRKRYRSEDYRGKLKGKKPISERPQGAQDRSEFGHWEADTVMGGDKFECVLTLVERKTGLARIAKICHRTASATNAALRRLLGKEPIHHLRQRNRVPLLQEDREEVLVTLFLRRSTPPLGTRNQRKLQWPPPAVPSQGTLNGLHRRQETSGNLRTDQQSSTKETRL